MYLEWVFNSQINHKLTNINMTCHNLNLEKNITFCSIIYFMTWWKHNQVYIKVFLNIAIYFYAKWNIFNQDAKYWVYNMLYTKFEIFYCNKSSSKIFLKLIGGIVFKNIFTLKDWYIITFTLKLKVYK
jgi:hypothetical protein